MGSEMCIRDRFRGFTRNTEHNRCDFGRIILYPTMWSKSHHLRSTPREPENHRVHCNWWMFGFICWCDRTTTQSD